MKIYLLKPFRQHKAKETVEMELRLAEAVLRKGIGIVVKETKEDKRANDRRTKRRNTKG